MRMSFSLFRISLSRDAFMALIGISLSDLSTGGGISIRHYHRHGWLIQIRWLACHPLYSVRNSGDDLQIPWSDRFQSAVEVGF